MGLVRGGRQHRARNEDERLLEHGSQPQAPQVRCELAPRILRRLLLEHCGVRDLRRKSAGRCRGRRSRFHAQHRARILGAPNAPAVQSLHAIAAALCLTGSAAHAADPWNLAEDFVAGAVADEDWTVNEEFPGTKLLFSGRYSVSRAEHPSRPPLCACEPLPPAERMLVTVGGHVQWDAGENDIEFATLSVTAWSLDRELDTALERLEPLRDTLELGVVQIGKDEPLGIESYIEADVVRVARTWVLEKPDSPWRFTVGANLSGGFAWAESTNPTYDDISNLTVGTWAKGTISRDRVGTIYLEQRVVNGWTFSSPAAGGPVARSAVARFGYFNGLPNRCLKFELFAEKRSFNFADPDAPNLYTKARRLGVEISCSLSQ